LYFFVVVRVAYLLLFFVGVRVAHPL
jgi:hypothetical protein